MKKTAIATQTMTYYFEFEVEDSATEEQIEDAAREEWGANPARTPIEGDLFFYIHGE